MFRKFAIFAALAFAAVCLNAQTPVKVTVYGLKGPSGVGMVHLFENPPRMGGYDVRMEALAQADLMAAKFISGEAKIGILPANVAAKLAASGKKIQIAAVTGTGMLSLLSADASVRRIEDLRGKTVEVAGQGATPDYVFRKILLSKGIKPDADIKLGYALAYPEIAQALVAGRVRIALLPEPFATMALAGNSKLALVGDIQQEWAQAGGVTGGGNSRAYPMTVLVVDSGFAAANRNLVKAVTESVRDSIGRVAANPAEAGQLAEKHELGLKAAVVAAAVPKSNYVFIPAMEARPGIEALLKVFLEFAPASIGGTLPADDFYWR